MGTNYYVPHKPPCPTCGMGATELHIGKSAFGWRFMFQAYPEHGLTTWAAWRSFLADKPIKDEYGHDVSLDALTNLIASKMDGKTLPSDTLDAEGHPFTEREFS